ncbi:MAG TPA: vitamin B12-dependent ribonucleotide reductase [Candidatus Bathyarchaeota archaeon]|nr:vitamin B12-dependent ribonucleotide reductase [Candidatus Bathyarchaeota archaeon]
MSKVSKITKRDGRVVDFDEAKITAAIHKAFAAVEKEDGAVPKQLSEEVVQRLNERFENRIPSVEDVQDLVEEVLIRNGYADVAKAYILYRQKRTEIRKQKKFFGVTDDLKLGVNAIKVLRNRYLMKNEEGKVIETPRQMFRRVAKAVAKADLLYDKKSDVEQTEETFYQIMANREFLPNSPTLMNAGTRLGQLSACFVLPVEDSIDGIFTTLKHMALIHQSGGGTGFSFSRLRPAGDIVGSTKGVASGPVSFMTIYDVATNVIKQGGRRRGANMAILDVTHPDILKFIEAKSHEGILTNFNISVAVTDRFMDAVENDDEYDLINPRNGEVERRLRARHVFDLTVSNAWRSGDPGLIFLDEINRHNPTPQVGDIRSTNPCGEQPLLPFESCNLGSINLAKMVKDGEVDWEKLRRTVRTAVHFLDNVIDVNKYPIPEIGEVTRANRKIGLGVMGFADMLISLGIPYDSEDALETGEKVMKFVSEEATKKSVEIAEKRGAFPNFRGSLWEKRGYKTIRNSTVTTVAPTGTISIIGGCSGGIEPIFAVAFVRNVMKGTRLLETQPTFEEVAKERRFYSRDLMLKVVKTGSIQDMKEVPEDVRRVFVTALDIDPEWHVRMQAAFQKYVDNAVSKTVNLPNDATVEDVKRIYLLAYKLKCKGITVYRYGSKKGQVLSVGSQLTKETETENHVSADSEYSGGCPTCSYPF